MASGRRWLPAGASLRLWFEVMMRRDLVTTRLLRAHLAGRLGRPSPAAFSGAWPRRAAPHPARCKLSHAAFISPPIPSLSQRAAERESAATQRKGEARAGPLGYAATAPASTSRNAKVKPAETKGEAEAADVCRALLFGTAVNGILVYTPIANTIGDRSVVQLQDTQQALTRDSSDISAVQTRGLR